MQRKAEEDVLLLATAWQRDFEINPTLARAWAGSPPDTCLEEALSNHHSASSGADPSRKNGARDGAGRKKSSIQLPQPDLSPIHAQACQQRQG
jgi:hypothetical protein